MIWKPVVIYTDFEQFLGYNCVVVEQVLKNIEDILWRNDLKVYWDCINSMISYENGSVLFLKFRKKDFFNPFATNSAIDNSLGKSIVKHDFSF